MTVRSNERPGPVRTLSRRMEAWWSRRDRATARRILSRAVLSVRAKARGQCAGLAPSSLSVWQSRSSRRLQDARRLAASGASGYVSCEARSPIVPCGAKAGDPPPSRRRQENPAPDGIAEIETAAPIRIGSRYEDRAVSADNLDVEVRREHPRGLWRGLALLSCRPCQSAKDAARHGGFDFGVVRPVDRRLRRHGSRDRAGCAWKGGARRRARGLAARAWIALAA